MANEKYILVSSFLKGLSGGSSAWQSFRISPLKLAGGDAVDVYRVVDVAQLPSVQKPDRRRRTMVSPWFGEFKIGWLKKLPMKVPPARPLKV